MRLLSWHRSVAILGVSGFLLFNSTSLSAEEEAAENPPASGGGEEPQPTEEQQPTEEKDAKRKEKPQAKLEVAPVSQEPTPESDADACAELSPAKRDLLLSLRKQREELIRREALLEQRRRALEKLEAELEAKMGPTLRRVEMLERRLEVGEARRKQAKEHFQTLVAAISSLSPRRAAPMLAQLAPNDAVRILIQLGPKRSGDVLSKMDPSYAAALITLVSKEAAPKSSERQPRRRGRGKR